MISDVKETTADIKTRIDSDRITMESILKRIREIEEKLDKADPEILKEQMSALFNELEVIGKYMDTLKARDYEAQIKDIYSSLGKEKVDIDNIRSTLNSLQTDIKGWKDRLDKLSKVTTDADMRLRALEKKLADLGKVEGDIHELAQDLEKTLDQIIKMEEWLYKLEKSQEGLMKWKEELSKIAGEEIKTEVGEIPRDKEIEELKKAVDEIIASTKAVTSVSTTAEGLAKSEVSTKVTKSIVEEVDVGSQEKTSSEIDKRAMELLEKIKGADPKDWGNYKKEMIDLLKNEIENLKKEVSGKNPPNAKVLNLMLTKAELGITFLSAAFDSGDFSKVDSIVKKTLQTIRDVRDQLG